MCRVCVAAQKRSALLDGAAVERRKDKIPQRHPEPQIPNVAHPERVGQAGERACVRACVHVCVTVLWDSRQSAVRNTGQSNPFKFNIHAFISLFNLLAATSCVRLCVFVRARPPVSAPTPLSFIPPLMTLLAFRGLREDPWARRTTWRRTLKSRSTSHRSFCLQSEDGYSSSERVLETQGGKAGQRRFN